MAGKDEAVVGLNDNLSFGPINPPEIAARDAFLEDLGYGFDEEQAEEIETFWERSLNPDQRRIVWLSQWSTQEYCGFLEWVRRNGEAPFEVIDLSDAFVTHRKAGSVPVYCTGSIMNYQFVAHDLWALARHPTPEDMSGWQALWTRLQSENAALRVQTPEGLTSANLDYFDDALLSQVETEWTTTGRVVGRVMVNMMDHSFREGGIYQTCDRILFGCLRQLAAQGRVERKGSRWDPQKALVRLPKVKRKH